MSEAADKLLSGGAWRDWCRRLEALGESILGDEFPASPEARAEGFRALTRRLAYATQLELEAGDALHPSFVRHQDPYNQWGGPNPDNVYLRANIDPAETYRVWCRDTRGMREAIFSLHEGEMHLGEYGVFGECSIADLELEPDGGLELLVSPEAQPRAHNPEARPRARNTIEADPRARILTIRIYVTDWERDATPAFHIERVGAEGVPRPPANAASVARGLERSLAWVEASVGYWNRYTAAAWDRATPNEPAPARATPGGADRIFYGSCFWDLAPEDALIVSVDLPDADYWNFATHTLGWLESGDFDQRITSLNNAQAHVDDDGRIRIAIAHEDPGVANWIDCEGRCRGMLVYRWIWARSNPRPEAIVVKRSEVVEHLPSSHPVVSPEERRSALACRREAVWARYI